MKSIKNILFCKTSKIFFLIGILCFGLSCKTQTVSPINNTKPKEVTAKDILGNPSYAAICYGGYRKNTRDIQPTIEQLKEDLKILAALQIKVVRTYNVKKAHASKVILASEQLKKEDANFEMYVMLGA